MRTSEHYTGKYLIIVFTSFALGDSESQPRYNSVNEYGGVAEWLKAAHC